MYRLLSAGVFLVCLSSALGFHVQVQGSRRHLQKRASALSRMAMSALDEPLIRIGHGYDIHRLKEGGKLVIAGVDIPYELGADAHSDGDAVYHSIVDAILGALSTNKDIGMLFPDNDPQWKGADSSIFMKEAVKVMEERGYRVGNLDVTLILQKPKVKDFKESMKLNIVKLLKTTQNRVNVKARTHEKVDSVGECKSYECHVVITLEKL
jgi:2-C-methyl-D-erythritol 2,4-cyclodiphosphate synthase